MAMRKVTDKERQIILEHPELVMFYDGSDKRRFAGGIIIIVIPAIIAALVPVPFFFTAFAEAHPNLMVILALLWVIAVICISVALIMRYSSVQEKRDDGDYHVNILRNKLAKELFCNVVTIKYIVPQKCEGTYIEDGKEQTFGYSGYKNYIPLLPDTKVAIVWDDADFFAFIKRDNATESLYREL